MTLIRSFLQPFEDSWDKFRENGRKISKCTEELREIRKKIPVQQAKIDTLDSKIEEIEERLGDGSIAKAIREGCDEFFTLGGKIPMRTTQGADKVLELADQFLLEDEEGAGYKELETAHASTNWGHTFVKWFIHLNGILPEPSEHERAAFQAEQQKEKEEQSKNQRLTDVFHDIRILRRAAHKELEELEKKQNRELPNQIALSQQFRQQAIVEIIRLTAATCFAYTAVTTLIYGTGFSAIVMTGLYSASALLVYDLYKYSINYCLLLKDDTKILDASVECEMRQAVRNLYYLGTTWFTGQTATQSNTLDAARTQTEILTRDTLILRHIQPVLTDLRMGRSPINLSGSTESMKAMQRLYGSIVISGKNQLTSLPKKVQEKAAHITKDMTSALLAVVKIAGLIGSVSFASFAASALITSVGFTAIAMTGYYSILAILFYDIYLAARNLDSLHHDSEIDLSVNYELRQLFRNVIAVVGPDISPDHTQWDAANTKAKIITKDTIILRLFEGIIRDLIICDLSLAFNHYKKLGISIFRIPSYPVIYGAEYLNKRYRIAERIDAQEAKFSRFLDRHGLTVIACQVLGFVCNPLGS